MHTGVLLLAIVAGYWLLERAASHRGNLKRVGQILGATVIVIALAGTVCKVWAISTGQGGWSKMGGWSCSYSKQVFDGSGKTKR